MKGELRECAHNNHPKQHSDSHRPARDPTIHFRFHKIRLYMRKGRLQPDSFDMQADLSPLKRAQSCESWLGVGIFCGTRDGYFEQMVNNYI